MKKPSPAVYVAAVILYAASVYGLARYVAAGSVEKWQQQQEEQ